ncbi:hypothetical protein ACQEPB_00325 [Novosphingobium fluoreni]|uniref:hypothetical protein n=1 Tax=Novosphingobium fluoreni TaxID=1391222 RepID=UPI003DA16EB5
MTAPVNQNAFHLGFAIGLLRDFLAAADYPADLRDQRIALAADRVRRELGEGGMLEGAAA